MSRKLLSCALGATVLAGPAIAEVPRVAVDIAPVHSLVARVMDGVGNPDLILPPGASPHEYSLRPSEARALQEADVVIWMGRDLTPWLEDALANLAGAAQQLPLLEAEATTRLEFRESALFEAHGDHGQEAHAEDAQGPAEHDHKAQDHDAHEHAEHDHEAHDHDAHDDAEHDHAAHDHDAHEHDEHYHEAHDHDAHDHAEHDHGHGAHDPHAWLAPSNAASWLDLIAAELAAIDPENAAAYRANAAAGRAELAALTAEVTAVLDPVRGGSFITFHDAFQYFETDFDIWATGAISLSDASDPSPARIAEIRTRVREQGIDCVLAEPQFNPGLVTTVLDGTAANTAVVDPIGVDLTPGAALYPQLIRNLARAVAGCL